MSYETTAFTFYKGVKHLQELREYIATYGELPDCEMFAELSDEDFELVSGQGYVAEEATDQELIAELPRTLLETS